MKILWKTHEWVDGISSVSIWNLHTQQECRIALSKKIKTLNNIKTIGKLDTTTVSFVMILHERKILSRIWYVLHMKTVSSINHKIKS